MSWSMREPEEPAVCECTYDEDRDVMDRDDCPFHCDMIDAVEPEEERQVERKPVATVTRKRDVA
jgi:hypothetical protein